MILYTPVPMDMVFPVRQPEPVTLERDGRYFTGIRGGSGCGSPGSAPPARQTISGRTGSPAVPCRNRQINHKKGTGPGPGSGPDDRSVRQRL